MKEKHIERIFEHLEKENFEYFYRQRINFHLDTPGLEKPIDKLCLNEAFVAEKDVGKTSIYRLQVDD